MQITILGNQIARVTREHKIIDWTLPALAQLDHFRDATKMIRGMMAAGFPVGATVKVTVEDKRLVIELDEAPVLTDRDKLDASLREAAKDVREREFERYYARKSR